VSGWREEAARLPIGEALGPLLAALDAAPNAVLVAPPGAGKTTIVPLALAEADWAAGARIIVLEPRRLAARAAAARMAALIGESAGQTVGYRVRLESRVSAVTRIEVVTEGVFTRMILDDPGLEGVAAVLFDEFHERSVEADLGLALARDVQMVLREDLRLLPMSATLDGAKVGALLGDAAVIEASGRVFPVETRYLGRDARAPFEPQIVRAILRGLDAGEGSVLAFLPGQGEISRTAQALGAALGARAVDIAPLYGGLDLADQDLAIAPPAPGRRKVVLATAIAQTSLTIEGVRVVVDGGLARVPRFDPAAGVTRLATVPVSRASADQRRGRAGRTAPGLCLRLWDEAQSRALAPYERPEILETDLSRLALDLARWGAADPSALAFLDPPPAAAFAEARRLLVGLRALDEGGALTPHGEAMTRMTLPPRLAHMILEAAQRGDGRRAARLAAVIAERGLGGGSVDLSARADGAERDRSPRARAALALADRWAASAEAQGPRGSAAGSRLSDGELVALAYPERIARARGGPGEFLLASGRGARLDGAGPMASAEWLAVAELGGGGPHDRILNAAALDFAAWRQANGAALTGHSRLARTGGGALRAEETVSLGAIVVERRDGVASPDQIRAALLDEVRAGGLGLLPWSAASLSLRARARFLSRRDASFPDLSDEALLADLEAWLPAAIGAAASLDRVGASALEAALSARLAWPATQRLETEAPGAWTAPTGSRLRVDYEADQAPLVRVRVQELFGLSEHPMVGGEPLTLALLSPAQREIQLTRDLPRFWVGSWAEVRKQMRGRYPKHPWPENPAAAAPTTRAKPRTG
jgi:ATP-dependent helicase HrpB